jgi:hypothetical protein
VEKTPDKLMSGIIRAEYIEADPNLSLYYTDADED